MNPIARLYDRYLLPPLLHAACNVRPIHRQRDKIVPLAAGRILEIGAGSGLNLPYYDPAQVQHLWALDPAPGMSRRLARAARAVRFPVEHLPLAAEQIPLADASVDAVIMTYTLCSIPNAPAALAQLRRVLRPGGALIFSEHSRDPAPGMARWQRRLTPAWRCLAGGCHLDRDIPSLIEAGGFGFDRLEASTLPGLAILRHHVWGVARPR